MMNWPPKDWRALAALIFSVLGAVILTVFVWWGVNALMPDQGWNVSTEAERAKTIRWVLWISSGAIGAVLIGLGMAINRRSFKGNIGGSGFDFQGGDGADPQAAAQYVANEAQNAADAVPGKPDA